jgi:hypothetical protein
MKKSEKKQRPLIRYAGSAAETSIGSKPIGSELTAGFYSRSWSCQAASLGTSSAIAVLKIKNHQDPKSPRLVPNPSPHPMPLQLALMDQLSEM